MQVKQYLNIILTAMDVQFSPVPLDLHADWHKSWDESYFYFWRSGEPHESYQCFERQRMMLVLWGNLITRLCSHLKTCIFTIILASVYSECMIWAATLPLITSSRILLKYCSWRHYFSLDGFHAGTYDNASHSQKSSKKNNMFHCCTSGWKEARSLCGYNLNLIYP